MKKVVVRALELMAPRYIRTLKHHRYVHGTTRLFLRPRTFNELIQRKKLFDHDPIYSITADKFAVREYVQDRIGGEYLIPLLLVTSDPRAIDFDALPMPFVIKATHGSGMRLFVRSRDEMDRGAIVATLEKWLDTDFSAVADEWAYRDIPRRIVIETMLCENGSAPADIKFFIFNGKVGLIQYDVDRFTNWRQYLFDHAWRQLDVEYLKPRGTARIAKPDRFDEMTRIATTLGRDFDFVRVDLYVVDGKVYFGELTHYSNAGLQPFKPTDFDRALGDLQRRGLPIPERFYVSGARPETRRHGVYAPAGP